MSHAGTEDRFLKTLFPQDMKSLVVLDVGHGIGLTGLFIRGELMNRGWCKLIWIDVYEPYHLLQKRLGIYDTLYLKDVQGEGLKYIPDKSVDILIAQQFIEHLPKDNGKEFLVEAERVTRKRIIICTPNGYHESGPGTQGNQHSEHLSAWYVKDFREYSYNTKVVSKNVNSRALRVFAKLWFWLQGKTWENEMIVAWKTLKYS